MGTSNNATMRGMKNGEGRERERERAARVRRAVEQYQQGEGGMRAIVEALGWKEEYRQEMEWGEVVAKLGRLGLLGRVSFPFTTS